MADAMLEKVRDALEAPIDFDGQRVAEQLTTNSIAIVGLLAFLVGYVTQNINYTLYTGIAGTLLVFVAIVPPWPWFNRHSPQWLPPKNSMSGISVNMGDRKAQ